MSIQKLGSYLAVGAVTLGLCACKTTESKPISAHPPAKAMAPTLNAATPTPATVQPPATLQPDPVEALISQADKEYQAGQANYSAGHLQAAKDNFDRAFNLLLESPAGVRSDDRLQQEFDKVVDGVHDLELVALQAGDGFTEQQAQPAPIDEANSLTFPPADPNIKAKLEAEVKQTHSDLPLVLNDAVAGYISYFSSRGRPVLERALERSGRYKDMIEGILKQEGIPQDLIYLAQAESGFQPLALSRAGARGLWQFMSSRANGYGLSRNWWVDDRQDPEKATRAAAQHLKDLYNEFGDWYLAMAAYNSGPGTVQAAVQRTGYADFWELYKRNVLPTETKNYVPIIVAVTIMAKNPAQYGLDHLSLDPPLKSDKVTIDYPVDLRLVAECVDTSVSQLQELNPSLLRMTTPKEGSFQLALPPGTADKFQQSIAAIPRDMRVWWRYHKVTPGESLAEVAREYHTTPRAIEEANNLADSRLNQVDKLIIPITPGKRAIAESEGLVFSKRATRYKVRKGDTVLSVAADFEVPASKLRSWNRLEGNKLRAGRILRIYRPVGEQDLAAARPRTRTRRAGARTAKTTAAKAENSPAESSNSNGAKVLEVSQERVVHKVKAGETLYSIATAYNTTVAALRRDNTHLSSNLHPGDLVIIRSR